MGGSDDGGAGGLGDDPSTVSTVTARKPQPAALTVKPLTLRTWPAFVALAEKHNGVWNGCWCTWFHPFDPERGKTSEGNRRIKERLVREGIAHAALVFDGRAAVGWCEYGTPEELPRINHRKQYEAEMTSPPDYRLTCFFVDRDYRRTGVAAVALAGALDLIAAAGGGVVEAYPQDTAPGEKVSASFLYNGTRNMFERAGFTYDRPKGPKHCVMRKRVRAKPATVTTPARKATKRASN